MCSITENIEFLLNKKALGGLAFGDLSGATDAYGYNGRSEVVSSRRTLADSPVRSFDYDYAYDPISNRTSATGYDEQGNPLVSSYTANALNQYTQRTVPGYAAVRGEAATNATVTVNERPVWRINQSIGGSAAPTSARSGGNLGGEAAQTSPQSGRNHFCLRETSCLFRDVVQE